ncbi:hypothetical protein DFH08DRAFT_883256 [Mycena albidolilacea]|uniref:F-box domain-containing protein n=1 Tax=Mycena albidolilacea TaxID=1033008 RepID=A0AAD7EIR1_9AGAR|nr:hypothetical protein DFH08DRAFT_883256 [Mycena albidolilacea]
MSVAELQAHIAKLSHDIDLQKEVLRQLEQRKRASQRQINALRDPLARLPLELSSEIFVQCLPQYGYHASPDARTAPMLFLQVCNAWNDIALSTPKLWTVICLPFPSAQILDVWLQRARNFPSSVRLFKGLDYDVARTLVRFSSQLKHLDLYEEQLDPLRVIGALPRLETLTIDVASDENGNSNAWNLAEAVQLLNSAPNLVQCLFCHVTTYFDDDLGARFGEVVLPNLRVLGFGERSVRSLDGEEEILQYLTLPALNTLFLSLSGYSTTDFYTFLERSSPPLQTLLLGTGCPNFRFIDLEKCFSLVPSLTYLELYGGNQLQFLDDLFTALADHQSHLLPNLHTLNIQHDCSVIIEPSYRKLLLALSVRRAQLGCAYIENPDPDQFKPSPEVCAGLRQLAENGMDLWIGTPEHNFIEV